MLALLEHYTSVQGEGPNTGELTQFVRFGGCNMRCPGWPCDTQHAIWPTLWRDKVTRLSGSELSIMIAREHERTGATNICLTGGEPFLQADEDLRDLCDILAADSFDVEVFTNGSFDLNREWVRRNELTFIMDWKLSGSGENLTKLDVRKKNAVECLDVDDCIKFVVKDMQDLGEAKHLTEELIEDNFAGEFYVGRVWDQLLTDQMIVEYIMKHKQPWKLNVQVHKYIWDPEAKGV